MTDLCTLSDIRAELGSQPGPVKATQVTAGGSGYSAITVNVVSSDGNGAGAAITGVLLGGALVGLTLTSPGQGYTAAPNLIITGNGTGAAGICYISEDQRLAKLITRASAFFLNATNRVGILPAAVTERRDGTGNDVIVPYWWPIISVQSVSIQGIPLSVSSDGIQPGYMNDAYRIMLINGGDFSRPMFGGAGTFVKGYQNIILGYTYGWTVQPEDITQAVVELVAQKYRRSQHRDQTSQRSTDGQVVSFSQKSIPDEVRDVINQYKIKAIIE